MRYLLALLFMIAVGGEAVAQTPVVSFEDSESVVTEGDSVNVSLIHDGGQSAEQIVVDVEIPAHDGYWPFADGNNLGADFSVTFEAGEDKATLSIGLRDDEIAQSQGEEFALTILNPGDSSYEAGDPRTHRLVWMDDEVLALPEVNFKTATSEAEEGSDLVGGVTDEEKNIHLTLDKPAENDLYVNVEIEKASGTVHWPFYFEDEDIGEAEKTVYFGVEHREETLDLSFIDDNAPRPPQVFKLKVIEEEDPPFSYRIGAMKENTLTVNDDDSIWPYVAAVSGGFKVEPNRASAGEDYTVAWRASGAGIAVGEATAGTLTWVESDIEPKTVMLDFDCARGGVSVSVTSDRVYVIAQGGDSGFPAADLCEARNSSGDGPPGTSTGSTTDSETPLSTSSSGDSGGVTGDGGEENVGGDDSTRSEVVSGSDGGCSLSEVGALNELASNVAVIALVLMFSLCLVLRGERRNVSDSLR